MKIELRDRFHYLRMVLLDHEVPISALFLVRINETITLPPIVEKGTTQRDLT